MAEDVTRPGPTADEPDPRTHHQRGVAAVVAAVDGSLADEAVVDWAADEAARTRRPVQVVHAIEPGYQLTPYEAVLGELPSLSEDMRAGGRAIVSAAAERARARRPGLEVSEVVEWGPPAAALVDLSDEAAWLVLGAPARHLLERVLLGSVALATVAHSTCPVAVVPVGQEPRPPHRVVVGVDGSPCSAHAVEVAMSAAEPVGGTVTCVVGWSVEVVDGVVVTEPGTPHWVEVEERYTRLVHQVLDPFARLHPDVPAEVVVRPGGAVRAVLDVAAEVDADLLVVGSRGRGGFTGLRLGSVSRRVVERASTVVAVVH